MKVKRKQVDHGAKFNSLDRGATFIEGISDEVWLKIESVIRTGYAINGNPLADVVNAVSLNDGSLQKVAPEGRVSVIDGIFKEDDYESQTKTRGLGVCRGDGEEVSSR